MWCFAGVAARARAPRSADQAPYRPRLPPVPDRHVGVHSGRPEREGVRPSSSLAAGELLVVFGAATWVPEDGVGILDASGSFSAHTASPELNIRLCAHAGERLLNLLLAGVFVDTQNQLVTYLSGHFSTIPRYLGVLARAEAVVKSVGSSPALLTRRNNSERITNIFRGARYRRVVRCQLSTSAVVMQVAHQVGNGNQAVVAGPTHSSIDSDYGSA